MPTAILLIMKLTESVEVLCCSLQTVPVVYMVYIYSKIGLCIVRNYNRHLIGYTRYDLRTV